MQEKKKNDKKSSAGVVIFFAVIALFNLAGESKLDEIMPILICAIVAIAIAVGVIGAKKNAGKTDKPFVTREKASTDMFKSEHSHDRLTVDVSKEDGLEHWKKQLDDFMKAGIIERSEYNALLYKYAQRLRNNK